MADQVAEFKDKKLKKYLKDLDKRFKNVKDAKKKYIGIISSNVYEDIINHFDKQMGPDGKWAPLQPQYAAWKKKKRKTKILVLSGAMRKGFTPIKRGANFRKVSGGILWFNPKKYSGKHDRGEGVPKRSFMWLSSKGFEKIAQQTLAFILDKK